MSHRLRFNWPCRASEHRLRGLYEYLSERHESVALTLVTDIHTYSEKSIDELLGKHITPRWKSLVYTCDGPNLSVALHDRPYNEVSIKWADDAARDSAHGAHRYVRDWRAWSQLPAHFLAVFLVVAALTVAAGLVIERALSPASKVESSAPLTLEEWRRELVRQFGEETADQVIEEHRKRAREQAAKQQASEQPARNWASTIFGAVIIVLLGLGGGYVLGIVLAWTHPEWLKLFPAFRFDVPYCQENYYQLTRLWSVLLGLLQATIVETVRRWLF